MIGNLSISNFFDIIKMDNYIECKKNHKYINLLFYCYELYYEDKQNKDKIYYDLRLFDNLIKIVTCVDELKYEL